MLRRHLPSSPPRLASLAFILLFALLSFSLAFIAAAFLAAAPGSIASLRGLSSLPSALLRLFFPGSRDPVASNHSGTSHPLFRITRATIRTSPRSASSSVNRVIARPGLPARPLRPIL